VANQMCSCSCSSLGNRELQGWVIKLVAWTTAFIAPNQRMFHIVGAIGAGITLNLKPLGCFTRRIYVVHATNMFTLQNNGKFFWYA